jgi:hypothetical protein
VGFYFSSQPACSWDEDLGGFSARANDPTRRFQPDNAAIDPIGLEAWSSVVTFQVVIAGLDPRIHRLDYILRLGIDARVEPWVEPAHDVPL